MSDGDKAVGFENLPLPVSWHQRDLVLYAASIGHKADELDKVYELAKGWQPFPTYPLVLSLKGATSSISNFAKIKDFGKPVDGLPALDPNKVVHAEQTIEVLKAIPLEATGWKLNRRTVGLHEKGGKGLLLQNEATLVDESGQVYTRMISTSYHFGKFDALKGYSKSIVPEGTLKPAGKPPTRDPDFVQSDPTSAEQAILYRLSGDYNPLHIDPQIGQRLGFGGVILHGLCSYGFAARALVNRVAKGDSTRFKKMAARFTSPVKPGDTLETLIWTEKAQDGSGDISVGFVQRIKENGKLSLGGGVALFSGAGQKL
ncbi:uncharacterized protein L969DRAFT_42663 [Mixia osmundae IAM 14324]|uniref:Uncharacterized protein n=1 Tax=Mixia osmundae (strain CBS 9802 / IAM 14324 / JCM 22182 / KY 12970) TaxID=764103 RepID=G7E392_MIXOS|nr:uncharacterized protein L969DRAFT_42663 [Mixia osmundae IAM 14324]KEI42438.1 hypothetical protein L969DRAFT_42663 [Mixia osmundae IAM 14324]GAA97273.1 hypothetical protein E5Q_03950 [Mixia osmundae IAM 14324]